MCEEGRDRERSCQFKRDREKMTDVAGGKERKGVKDNPWETARWTHCPVSALLLLLPVCFAMVTRQGSQCSQLMCFSVAGASGVLMCLSPSPAQSMSTVLGCTNTWRAESQGTLGHPGWASGRESERGPRHNYLKAALVFCEVVRQLWQWSFVLFWRSLISHVDHYYIDL